MLRMTRRRRRRWALVGFLALCCLALWPLATWGQNIPPIPADPTGHRTGACSYLDTGTNTFRLCDDTTGLPVTINAMPALDFTPAPSSTPLESVGVNFYAATGGPTTTPNVGAFITDYVALSFANLQPYISLNRGRTWATFGVPPTALNRANALAGINNLIVLAGRRTDPAVADSQVLWISSNGGASFSRYTFYGADPLDEACSMAVSGLTIIVAAGGAAGNEGGIYRSGDGLASWQKNALIGNVNMCASGSQRGRGIKMGSATWLLPTNQGGTFQVQRSTDDGLTWATVGAWTGMADIAAVSATRAYAVQSTNIIYYTADGGATWGTYATLPALYLAYSIVGVEQSTLIVAVRDSGTATSRILRLAAPSTQWTEHGPFPTNLAGGGAMLFANGLRDIVLVGESSGGSVQYAYSPGVQQGDTRLIGANGFPVYITPQGRLSVQADFKVSGSSRQQCSLPAANTQASIAIGGVAGAFPTIYDVVASYDVAPAAQYFLSVTASTGPITVWTAPILQPGGATQWIYSHTFSAGLSGTSGEVLTAILPAGGVGVSGKLCITGANITQ